MCASPRRARPARMLLAVGCALLALVGCAPSEPSTGDWLTTADQALEDTASEVESVALVLRLQGDDRLPGRAAQVAAVESEDSLATAEQGFTSQQPPSGTEREDTEVGELMTRASELVREARIALTAGDVAAYDGLRRRLKELSGDIDEVRGELR